MPCNFQIIPLNAFFINFPRRHFFRMMVRRYMRRTGIDDDMYIHAV